MKPCIRANAFVAAAVAFALVGSARADVIPLVAGPAAGPTVLVVTDTFAGDLSADVALRQVAAWPLARGRVVTAGKDELPAAVAAAKPAAVVVLRTARYTKESATVEARGVDAGPLVDTLNGLTEGKGEKLSADPAGGHLPAVDAVAGAPAVRVSLIVKDGGTNPAARARMFRHAVYAVLAGQKMADGVDPWLLARRQPGLVNVAVYVGVGSESTPGVKAYPKALTMDPGVRYTFVGAAEIRRPGGLSPFDAIVFPGGMSNAQGKVLGTDGAKAVQDFVRAGGGYVSSCAGSYLASTHYDWSLGIINSDVLDAAHWLRGSGDVDIELTDAGRAILGDFKGLVKCHYANGPLLAAGKAAGLGAFTPLAYYRSDMAKSAKGGVMPNTPAIIAGDCGSGRVLCFSPHPEYTAGLEGFVARAVRWTARKPAAETATAEDATAEPKPATEPKAVEAVKAAGE
ncbi:MAG: Biotin-protein ligase, partial [Phycisphaerales bacterium]|nr:Biotin-protein ligase [Phycisphaerales bacterium]